MRNGLIGPGQKDGVRLGNLVAHPAAEGPMVVPAACGNPGGPGGPAAGSV